MLAAEAVCTLLFAFFAHERSGLNHVKPNIGIRLLGIFLLLSTGILVASAVTLLWPGTGIDGIWAMKPEA